MKDKDTRQVSPAMVEDKATERLKDKARDLGLIVNAGVGKKNTAAVKKKDDKK
ncbi:MAG TPA: hypothetical protein VM866_06845 [Pyrinomonadaceae bacterium]|jgi:hypothetical protein|nr:hypothetical protein [Pyrinomonadaceae bacterium]